MLDKLFMQILDMSIAGSFVILVVLLARLLLKKAPKVISYALWSVVLLRLLCPVSIQAPISVLPEITPVEDTYTLTDVPISLTGAGVAAYQAVGDMLNGGIGLQHVPTINTDEQGNIEYVTSDWGDVWVLFGQYVWIMGVAVMVIYSAVTYWKLKRRLDAVIHLRENIYLADEIPSPCVIGFIKPKIYLPNSLSAQEQAYIIAHEQHHIHRCDHIIKMLAFTALAIHWMNPLVWVAFLLASRDMEMSCDEAVIRKFGPEVRADYAASLLNLATGRRIIGGTPLAFCEGDPKGRIKNLARWKKPAVWITVAAVVFCSVLAVCLLTDPEKENDTMYADQSWYYGTVSDRAMSVVNEGNRNGREYLSIAQEDGNEVQFWIALGYTVPDGIAVGDYVKVLGSLESKTGLTVAQQVEPVEPEANYDEQKYQLQLEEQKRKELRLRKEAEAAAETRITTGDCDWPDWHHQEADHHEEHRNTHHH